MDAARMPMKSAGLGNNFTATRMKSSNPGAAGLNPGHVETFTPTSADDVANNQISKLRQMAMGRGATGHSSTMLVNNNDKLGQIRSGTNGGGTVSGYTPTSLMHQNGMLGDIQARTADQSIDTAAANQVSNNALSLLMK